MSSASFPEMVLLTFLAINNLNCSQYTLMRVELNSGTHENLRSHIKYTMLAQQPRVSVHKRMTYCCRLV